MRKYQIFAYIFALFFSCVSQASFVFNRTNAQLVNTPLLLLYAEYRNGVRAGLSKTENGSFERALRLHAQSFSSHWQVIVNEIRGSYFYGAEFHPDVFIHRFKSLKDREDFFERYTKNYEEKIRALSSSQSPRTHKGSTGVSHGSYNLSTYIRLKAEAERLKKVGPDRYFKVYPNASPFQVMGKNLSKNRGAGEAVVVIDDFSKSYWNEILTLPQELKGKFSRNMRQLGLRRVFFRSHSLSIISLITSRYGYAPRAEIIPIEWYFTNRSFQDDIRSLPTSARVVNISLSKVKFKTLEILCPGRIVVLSAGNASLNMTQIDYWKEIRRGIEKNPWIKNHLIIALAVGPDGKSLASFSNFPGDDDGFQDISFCVCGEDIQAHAPIWNKFASEEEEISGTSMSAALLSGMITARFSDHSEETPSEVLSKLRASTKKIGNNRYFGRGLVSAESFLGND